MKCSLVRSYLFKKEVIFFLFFILFLTGCKSSQSNAQLVPKKAVIQKPVLKRVSNRPGDKKGAVFIAEYHRVLPKEGLYTRSTQNFRKDLDTLYKLGFRPVTLSEFVEGKMTLPPGASPVVLTFDDSSLSQFKMLPDGKIDPQSAVGILENFSKEHPDFPVKATFFILPKVPFGQPGWVNQKLALIKSWGCEIGSHTLTHSSMRKLSDEKIKQELGGSIDWIRSLGFEPKTMAVPYGVMPKKVELLKSFTWNGKPYGFIANVRSMGRPAHSFDSKKPDNPYRLARIIGSDEPMALTYWLKKVEQGEVQLYIQP